MFKLRTKLTLMFALIAAILIIVTGLFGQWMLENHFKNYVIEKQEKANQSIVQSVSNQYINDSWDVNVIENIGMRALEEGLIVKVIDLTGKTVWDATVHNNGMCQQMLSNMANNMASKYPSFNGKYTVSSYPMTQNFKNIGTLQIGYYGPFYFNNEDLHFINALNSTLLWVSLIALLLSLLLGHLFAKRLSDPINRVIHTAQMIEKGDYTKKSSEKTTTKEINELVATVNNLAVVLNSQEKLRKRLTGDVAHELRTPLATLQSHIEAMIDGIWEPTTDRLKSCHEEIVRLGKMVGDIQLLTGYEGKINDVDKTEFDLNQMISNVLINFENQFKSKGIDIHLEGKGTIVADQDKIRQVMINLISNALKYTPKDGKVEITIADNKHSTDITVKDTGCGISEEDMPYIFERFYRADKSRNRLTGGAGIGLSIVKSIVDAHDGTIQVESKMSEGTTFIVSLPKK